MILSVILYKFCLFISGIPGRCKRVNGTCGSDCTENGGKCVRNGTFCCYNKALSSGKYNYEYEEGAYKYN